MHPARSRRRERALARHAKTSLKMLKHTRVVAKRLPTILDAFNVREAADRKQLYQEIARAFTEAEAGRLKI